MIRLCLFVNGFSPLKIRFRSTSANVQQFSSNGKQLCAQLKR